MKVLLVDDNIDFLNLLEEMIKVQGHTPLRAVDGKQAREILADTRVDAIISDVVMPTLDGVRLHSYVREFIGDRNVPFIFVSGYDDPYTQEAIEDPSKDFFISKMTPAREIMKLLDEINSTITS